MNDVALQIIVPGDIADRLTVLAHERGLSLESYAAALLAARPFSRLMERAERQAMGRDRLVALALAGVTPAEIGRRLGVTAGNVSARLSLARKQGIRIPNFEPLPGKRISAETIAARDARIIALAQAGTPPAAIARMAEMPKLGNISRILSLARKRGIVVPHFTAHPVAEAAAVAPPIATAGQATPGNGGAKLIRNEAIVTAREKGLTLGQIAERHGLSRGRVMNILAQSKDRLAAARKNGHAAPASPPAPPAEPLADTVARLTRKGTRLTAIAAITGRPYREIAALQDRLGLGPGRA